MGKSVALKVVDIWDLHFSKENLSYTIMTRKFKFCRKENISLKGEVFE